MKIETECGKCGRKKGHTKNCPIYLQKFINNQPPTMYAMPDGTPLDELETHKSRVDTIVKS